MSLLDSGKKLLQGLLRSNRTAGVGVAPEGTDPGDAPTFAGSGPPVDPTAALEGAPAVVLQLDKPVGHYRLRRLLGEGGMGRVYEAFDTSLQRLVALKLVRIASEEAKARILQEARAQAKVEHPNICKIFEVGDHEGQPFIAMQRILGRTLDEAAPSLSLEQKVLAIKQAAEALHAAHQVGLIHRDLKPANIMVERSADGALIPFVMDFGLARDADSKGLTVAGHVMGTPAYMAPEQAESGAIDRRCDVYGLGATLYSLLCGRPPFEGGTLAALMASVLTQDAPSLSRRAPQVPRDLDTIVMKCLEKAPAQRYGSARALAEDLGRFLEGEPILARPAGFFGRLARRARKQKALAVVAAVSAVAVVSLGAWGLATRLRARARAASAQRFGQVVERVEGFWRQALLLPAHDLTREREVILSQMSGLGAEMGRLGPESQGPGHYALGRAELALGRPGPAREELERSWSLGYRSPELSLALGESLAQLYERDLREARNIPSKELRRMREEELAKTLRDPALARLKEGSASFLASPALMAARQAYLRGDLAAAEDQSRQAVAERPWLFEAKALEGKALLAEADLQSDGGAYAQAAALLERAGSVFDAAQSMARSDPSLAMEQAKLAYAWWWAEVHRGGPARPWLEATLQRADAALVLQPDLVEAWLLKAHILRSEAIREDDSSDQRLDDCRRSVEMALRAKGLSMGPGHEAEEQARCALWLGACYATLAATEQARSLDPGPDFLKALESLDEASRLDPGAEGLDQTRGDVYGDVAAYEEQRGGDPMPRLEKAVACYRKLLDRRPRSLSALNNLGFTFKEEGRYLMGRDRDPEPAFREAEDAFRKTVELSPSYAYGWNNLCVLASYRARHQMGRGEDPTAATARGLEWGAKAVAANAKDGHFYLAQMEHWIWRARYALATGSDPGPAFAKAEALLAKGLELRPADLYSHYCAVWLSMQEAQARMLRGQDASGILRRAESALAKGLALSPGNRDLLEARAEWALLAAESGAGDEKARQALADAQAVLVLDPRSAEARLVAAEALRLKAEKGRGPSKDLEEASRFLDEASAMRPGMWEALGLRGACLALLAEREPAHAPELRAKAREAAEASLKANGLQASPMPCYDPRVVPLLLKRL